MKDLDTERLSLCLAVTMSDVGNTHWALGDFYKAEANFIDALSLLRRENFSEAHPRAYSMRNRLFTLYRHAGITPKKNPLVLELISGNSDSAGTTDSIFFKHVFA